MEQNDSITSHGHDYEVVQVPIITVVTSIIIFIGLPLTLVAIYSLHSLVKKDHIAPIFVINLLISDLIQFCCMISWVVRPVYWGIYESDYFVYVCSLMVSVCFMVCIALERYLVVAHPLWYRFRRTIKTSVVVSVVVWLILIVSFVTLPFWDLNGATSITVGSFFLLPLPLFIFFLVGTLRALSTSISVPAEEKRRIVGILVLVLLIYTVLFLPIIIPLLARDMEFYVTQRDLILIFLRVSPLADLVLYVFMRKGTVDKLLASVCCCRMESQVINNQHQVDADRTDGDM